MATDLPLKELFCRHTLATGEPLRCNLRTADYLSGRSPFSVAERVMYDSGENKDSVIVVLPIEWRTQPYLFASCPAALESEILPLLQQSLPSLQCVFAAERDGVRKYARKALLATGRKLSLGGLGEFAAAFAKEFLKP